MRLFIVRHADAAPGEPDDLRLLTPAGRAQARALGKRLPRLDAVLTSPLLRARETGALIARAQDVEPQADDRLGPGATADDVRAAVAGRTGTVVVIAHQPDCSRIAAALGGGEVDFAPGEACEVEL